MHLCHVEIVFYTDFNKNSLLFFIIVKIKKIVLKAVKGTALV